MNNARESLINFQNCVELALQSDARVPACGVAHTGSEKNNGKVFPCATTRSLIRMLQTIAVERYNLQDPQPLKTEF